MFEECFKYFLNVDWELLSFKVDLMIPELSKEFSIIYEHAQLEQECWNGWLNTAMLANDISENLIEQFGIIVFAQKNAHYHLLVAWSRIFHHCEDALV